MSELYLQTRAVQKHYAVRHGLQIVGESKGVVRAVDGVDLTLRAGETLGLVGESGCGKSTLMRLLLRLIEPTSGAVEFKGRKLQDLTAIELREYRKAVQPVFQNPFSSLDPRMRISRIISEPLRVNTSLPRLDIAQRVADVLRMVGLHASDAEKYPHEFSGGQRQRIAIARALASQPSVMILDEAVSSQDISIRAQILNLLKDLQARFGMSYLYISHDLATVRYMSDRISVMYLGEIVETASSSTLCDRPKHPYTQALLASSLPDGPEETASSPIHATLQGEPPSPLDPPSGCRFHTRCAMAIASCAVNKPRLREVAVDHWVACDLVQAES